MVVIDVVRRLDCCTTDWCLIPSRDCFQAACLNWAIVLGRHCSKQYQPRQKTAFCTNSPYKKDAPFLNHVTPMSNSLPRVGTPGCCTYFCGCNYFSDPMHPSYPITPMPSHVLKKNATKGN